MLLFASAVPEAATMSLLKERVLVVPAGKVKLVVTVESVPSPAKVVTVVPT